MTNRFQNEMFDKLKYYVYRLIDPRDGWTFYVGRGQKNRIFAHIEEARNGKATAELEFSEKIKTIQAILNEGLEPIHIIHRHGMTEEESALVEAALIDVYPGLTNLQSGIRSDELGPKNAIQLINHYRCETMAFKPTDRLLLIKINQTMDEHTIYEAVRYAWKISIKRAQKAEYVLAIDRGLCRGVFRPEKWMDATVENFPALTVSLPLRCGFEGEEASAEIKTRFLNKRLPEGFAKRGQANPCAYKNI